MYSEQDFRTIDECDMCGCKDSTLIYISDVWGADGVVTNNFEKKISVVRCRKCGFVYAQQLLNEHGRNKFWKNYSTDVHQKKQENVAKRKKMYQLEFDFINKFLEKKEKNDILDVGCADGSFLDFFSDKNNCFGVEIGKDALDKARLRYPVFEGDLPQIRFDKKFDLIILRGVIQYIEKPIQYFDKVIELLNPNGLVFIASTPNANSFVHNLFGEYFTLPVCAVAGKGFSPVVLNCFFEERGLYLVGEKYFYEETPYADVYKDIRKVINALEEKKAGRKIKFKAPAFWGNMMTLVYKKRN